MTELQLPSQEELRAALVELSQAVEPIARCISALETGKFVHPDGRIDELGLVRVSLEQAALISHLCRQCPLRVSVEVGFGMGSSATIILGTRTFLNPTNTRLSLTQKLSRKFLKQKFEHFIFDPYGLPDGNGRVVQDYLKQHFASNFRRVAKPSEIGLAQLLDERGPGCAGLVYIDGGHRFENVMIDFVLADQLCCEGGYIMFDDAWFPAIETVINYIRANRPNYSVAHLPVPNASVIKKIGADQRDWSAFKPFPVPNRCDWEAAVK